MLHTVNKSPFASSSLADCLAVIGDQDVLLLLEDGVYAAAAGTGKADLIMQAVRTHRVCAIQADVQARGLEHLVEGVELVDYGVFVDLLEQHPSHAWL